MDQTKIKLKPCPFCGRRAELRHDKDGFSFILCANDGCYVQTDGHLNEESAIKNWNTRKLMDNIEVELRMHSGRGYRDVDGDYVPPMIKTDTAISIVRRCSDGEV